MKWKAGAHEDISPSDGAIEHAKIHEETKGTLVTLQKEAPT